MRIRCSFTLDPDQYQSHSEAVIRLRQWQKQERSLEESNQAQQARRNAFHRDLYLSGLFLHQISPQLTGQLSARLGEPDPAAALQQCLGSAGIDNASESRLSDGQWQQLTSMLKTAMAAPKPDSQQVLTPITEQLTQINQRLNQLPEPQTTRPDLSELQHQLAELAQGQQALLDRLENGAAKPQTDLSAPLLQLKQGQQKLLAQLKELQQDQGYNHRQAEATPALESQLEKASRVKAKGLW